MIIVLLNYTIEKKIEYHLCVYFYYVQLPMLNLHQNIMVLSTTMMHAAKVRTEESNIIID